MNRNIRIANERRQSVDGTLDHEFYCPCGVLVDTRKEAHYSSGNERMCASCADAAGLLDDWEEYSHLCGEGGLPS